MGILITLTEDEMQRARDHALAIQKKASKYGLQHKFTTPGETETDWQTRGFAAEIAVAKWLGKEWRGWLWEDQSARQTKKGDVAGIEVRNARRDNGYLYVYENDPDDRPVLLTTGTGPEFTIVGWLFAREVRHYGTLGVTDSGKASWKVPQSFLKEAHSVPVAEETAA